MQSYVISCQALLKNDYTLGIPLKNNLEYQQYKFIIFQKPALCCEMNQYN